MLRKLFRDDKEKALPTGDRLARAGRIYRNGALLLLNTLLLFMVLNLFALLGIHVWQIAMHEDPISRLNAVPPMPREKEAALRQVYPGFSAAEISGLLAETWSRGYVFQPYTHFKERAFQGDFINVSEYGFRETARQKPWPPEKRAFNIFLFGGSTAFGYGVADSQTVANCLEDALNRAQPAVPVRVYNFARGGYYSSQELVLFLRLLSEKQIPQAVLFIDGLNEFWFHKDEPFFSEEFRQFLDQGYGVSSSTDLASGNLMKYLPLYRLLYSAKQYLTNHYGTKKQLEYTTLNDAETEKVVNTYLHNKRLITAVAESYGIKPLFVWQPVPTYNYDLAFHPFIPQGFGQHVNSKQGYARMAEYLRNHPQPDNFIWAADIQLGFKEPLYVDKVHYSPKMSQILAGYIADAIRRRNLLPMP